MGGLLRAPNLSFERELFGLEVSPGGVFGCVIWGGGCTTFAHSGPTPSLGIWSQNQSVPHAWGCTGLTLQTPPPPREADLGKANSEAQRQISLLGDLTIGRIPQE